MLWARTGGWLAMGIIMVGSAAPLWLVRTGAVGHTPCPGNSICRPDLWHVGSSWVRHSPIETSTTAAPALWSSPKRSKLEPKRKLPDTQNFRAFHPLHFELFCPHNAPPLSRIQLHKTAKRWLPPHFLSMSGANTPAGQLKPKVLIPSASIALSSPTSKRTSRTRSPLPSSMPITRTSGFRTS